MKFQKKILDNGLVVLFEKRDVPVTTVMLASRFGAIYEGSEEKGIAHVMEHMAFKGTGKRNALQIASEVEKIGGTLNAFTDEEETAYHVKLPSEHLDKAMEIIFDIFFNPAYPEEEIKKEQNVICEEIKMYDDDPRMNAMEGIKGCLYKSPFGMFIAGTQETVRNLGRKELIEKHKKFYSPGNAILVVVGNNDFNEVCSLAEKMSPNAKYSKSGIPKIEARCLKTKKKRADIQQANLTIGFHIPVEMKYAADVFCTILGEGMSSKLFTEVREKRGLAYAVKAFVQMTNNFGHLIIFVGTEPGKADEVVKLCVEEFKKMGKISERELEEGKQQISGNFQVAQEDSSQAAVDLLEEELSGKAENHYKYIEKIQKVSLDDIKRLAEIKDYACYVLTP
jgi:predicted Zn-dependent peptidase